ncbi:hypothetical protein SCA03_31300 [Streptomyces cacaoi]|uniref:Uncharacterized protein n=1 Tax=Streptomyces cacaoi TaxID=1898 RepID=A0A4Y3R030_STRCI|nr:hypothetical protein SCA03_31300 [Streptomyces cacaoi]
MPTPPSRARAAEPEAAPDAEPEAEPAGAGRVAAGPPSPGVGAGPPAEGAAGERSEAVTRPR